MLSSYLRKAKQLADDPTLRAWLYRRLLGQVTPIAIGQRSWPPYLKDLPFDRDRTAADIDMGDLKIRPAIGEIILNLPGETVRVRSDTAAEIFDRPFDDTESLLALHRFAWISELSKPVDPAWVACLWDAWVRRFAVPGDHWAWHPYTAAERLINILTFARRHGVPGPRDRTLAALYRHGPAIMDRLEYFGENQTGNHLANNGRGLYLSGIWLGLDDWASIGLQILRTEAARMFAQSGVLREGSSHYHLLAARWFWQAWKTSADYKRPEEAELRDIAQSALSVIPRLILPGGLPLIGDVSPDVTPRDLLAWAKAVSREVVGTADALLGRDGWIRGDYGDWHALWFVSPDGWPPLPGHGHRDLGSFELHRGNVRLFCDIGRRTYGSDGEVDISSAAHNSMIVDGAEPSPINKPYYSSEFRKQILDAAPKVVRDRSSVQIVHEGFKRLGDVGPWSRAWRFTEHDLVIEDRLDGRGRHRIERYLHTDQPVNQAGGAIGIAGGRLRADDARTSIVPTRYWTAYGQSTPASTLKFASDVNLPWVGKIHLTFS